MVPVPQSPSLQQLVVTANFDLYGSPSVTVDFLVHSAAPPACTPLQSLQAIALATGGPVTNPAPPASSGDWANDIVTQNRSSFDGIISWLDLPVYLQQHDQFPICAYEWTQVTAPGEDYDEDSVVFSGWLLQPEISGNDLPFSHPFGNDWECMVGLDPPYVGLMAAGNAVPDGADGKQALADAVNNKIPVPDLGVQPDFKVKGRLLAVEADGGCVPSAFNPNNGFIRVGDRIAVLGRWIVDTGHSVSASDFQQAEWPAPAGGTSYRAEVHPPLLMAIGGTRTTATGDVTRIMLTSRPYLVKQVYTTDTTTIYKDDQPNDGPFLEHFNNEIDKVKNTFLEVPVPLSWTIEAHPKIAEKPFQGVHGFCVRVRPPTPQHFGPGGVGPPPGPIQVRFQFTCRSGVGVQVVGADDGVNLIVTLNSAGYSPPALPTRQTVTKTKDQLGGDGDLITYEQWIEPFTAFLGAVNAEHALAHGIDTDTYDVPDVNVLDQAHMTPFVAIDHIPAGQGIVVDNGDGQPYPVFGWLEIRHGDLLLEPEASS